MIGFGKCLLVFNEIVAMRWFLAAVLGQQGFTVV
jgi:hypothetical protein